MTFEKDRLTGAIDFRNPKSEVATLAYLNRVARKGTGRIAVVFADIVGLSELNRTAGTAFADRLIGEVGSSLNFNLDPATEYLRSELRDVTTSSTRHETPEDTSQPGRIPDLAGRLGGDEVVCFAPLTSEDEDDEIADTHGLIGRIERNLAFRIQEDVEMASTLYHHGFPLRFGYSFHSGDVDSLAEILRPSDTAVNLAKIIGIIRARHALRQDSVRVFHQHSDERGGVKKDEGYVHVVTASPDSSQQRFGFHGEVARYQVDPRDIDPDMPFTDILTIRGAEQETVEAYVGLRYRTPFTRQLVLKPDFVSLRDYDAQSFAPYSQGRAPDETSLRREVERVITEF